MACRIIYHPKAVVELDKLYDDLATEDGISVAGEFVDGIITFIEALDTFPDNDCKARVSNRALRPGASDRSH